MRITWATAAFLSLSCHLAFAGQLGVWCIDDMAKIDPVSGKAREEELRQSGGQKSDYAHANFVWNATRGSVKLTAARNEVVAFQIILEAKDAVKGVTFVASDLTGPGTPISSKNVSLFREWYINVANTGLKGSLGNGWYPDALIPLELGTDKYGAPLDIPDARNKVDGQKNQAVWVDVYVPATAQAGVYKGRVEIGGPEKLTIPVELEVMNFELPNTYHYFIDLNNYGEKNTPIRLKTYQLMQQHRIYFSTDSGRIKPGLDAAGNLDWAPYDEAYGPLLDGSAFTEKHGYKPGPMTGTPVVMLELPFNANVPRKAQNHYRGEAWPMDFSKAHTPAYDKLFKDTLKAFETHFKEKGWTKTTYIVFFNGGDEPTSYAEYQAVKYLGDLVEEVKSPLFRHKVDIGHFGDCASRVKEFKSMQDMLDFMRPSVDVWCGNGGVTLFNVEAAAAEVKKGKQVFYYGTNLPPGQGGTYVDSEGLGARLWPLIAARYEITGGELWHYMVKGDAAWNGQPTDDRRLFGYAQYVYPDQGLGVDFGTPIASIRLKGFRRGQQDAEYFWMARQAGQHAAADGLLNKLIPQALDKALKLGENNPGIWSHNPDDYEQARLQIGKLLAK